MTDTTVPTSDGSTAARQATPQQESTEVTTDDRSRSFAIEAWVLPISLILLIAFLLLIGHPAHIREWATWRNLAAGSAIAIVVALGLVIPLRAAEFNLAIGVCGGASAIMTATMYVTYDEMLWVCILTGIATGLVIGAVAGVLVGYFRVNSLIATLGIGILIQGIVEWRTPSGGISALNATQLTDVFNNKIGPIDLPPAVPIALVLALIAYYVLDHVPFGRNLTAIGSNRTAATLVGVRVPRAIFTAFAISGLLGGIAGVLILGSFGSVSSQLVTGAGVGYWLPALAAVYLGATAFQPGRFNVPGAVIAIVAVKLVRTLFSLANVTESWPENVVNGAALLGALAAASYLARRRGSVRL
ncbi:MAG: ABC transporter permease [Actinomycetota bacterium]|nr:ABC transporter permease [Actinomycetota bacterium]